MITSEEKRFKKTSFWWKFCCEFCQNSDPVTHETISLFFLILSCYVFFNKLAKYIYVKSEIPNSIYQKIDSCIRYYSRQFQFKYTQGNYDDFKQAGEIAFWKAVKSYDPFTRASLTTFSSIYIRRGIQKEYWGLIVGEKKAKFATSVWKAKTDIEIELAIRKAKELNSLMNAEDIIDFVATKLKKNKRKIRRVFDSFENEGMEILTNSENLVDLIAERLNKSRDDVEEILKAVETSSATYAQESNQEIPYEDNRDDVVIVKPNAVDAAGLGFKDYGLISSKLCAFLTNDNCGLLSPLDQKSLLKDKKLYDLAIKRRLILRKMITFSEREIENVECLEKDLLSLDLIFQMGSSSVYQRRKKWKKQEEAVLKETELTGKLD